MAADAKTVSSDGMTLSEFLERYPWPAEWLKKGKPMHFFWKFDLPVPVQKLWPYIADLSAFNKRVGLGEMKFTEKNGRLQGFAVNVGKKMVWEEVPWEWEYGKQFSHARVYSEGLPYYMRARYLFEEPTPGTRRLYTYMSWIPRGPISRLLINIGLRDIKKGYIKALREIVNAIQKDEALAPSPVPKLSAEVQARLKTLQEKIVGEGAPQDLVERLVHYLKTKPDETLYRMRVKALAKEWGVRERDLLWVFLSATRAGLLNLTWDVICPHCRGVREEVRHLGELPKKGNCEVCRIDFDATSFNVLEVTFHVHPSIRAIEKRVYCAAEAGTKPHIKLQKTIPSRAELALGTLLAQGRYRLRVQGSEDYNLLDIQEDTPTDKVLWEDSLAQKNFISGYFPTVVLKNGSAEPKTFILEESREDQEALRPVDLFSFQSFRDLFSQEALAADLKLEIGIQTLLFTDLVGSTQFYAREGDAAAFAEVRRHFLKTYEAVKDHQGAVVKTIGDAVMAAFVKPLDALRAAVQMQRYFNGRNPETPLRLRVTLHTGPCLAVNLNSNIDYFGNTVNLAAKIQAVAGAGQIGFTEKILRDGEIEPFLKEQGLAVEKVDFETKWDGKKISVYRIEVK